MSNEDRKESGGNGGGGGNGTAAAAEGTAAAETGDDKVARLEKDKADTHERMLRIAADFENYKKRARRDVDEAVYRARETLLREILPVLDNLERANTAAAKADASQSAKSLESLAQGVKLVEKQLQGALEKFEIKGFDALGQAFDPNRHEAIQQVETDKQPAGTVAEVFARGYTIGDRLLRPAMVAVAKAPPSRGGNGAGHADDGSDAETE